MKDELASAEADLAAVPEPPDHSEEIRELKTKARKIASDVMTSRTTSPRSTWT